MLMSPRAARAAAAILVLSLSGAAGAARLVLDERLVGPLERAVMAPVAARGDDSGLAALRRLRDPALAPLFGCLASSSHPILRRHGVLGLAEIESPPRLRPVLLSKVTSPTERAFIVGEALATDLFTTEDIEELLKLSDLDPFLEVVLRGELGAAGRDAGVERLRSLSEEPEAVVAVPALLQLCSAGDSDAGERLVERVAALPPAGRGAPVAVMFEQIRRDGVTGCRGVMPRVYELVRDDPVVSLDALRAWLMVDGAAAGPEWQRAFASASGLSGRLRLALVGLEASSRTPPAVFAPLDADESELVRAIGRLAVASATGDGLEEAIRGAAAHSYPPVEAWLVERLPEAHPEVAQEAQRAIIQAAAGREPSRHVTEGVALAAERLAPSDPKFVSERITSAAGANDRVLSQALLTGLLRANPAPRWNGSAVAQWPDRVTAALALVAGARCDPEFAADEKRIERLTEVAAGGSGLPGPLRVQAAWLAARLQGNGAEAIATVVAELDP